MSTKTKIETVSLVFIILLGLFAVPRAQQIGDFFYFLHYNPPLTVERIADGAGMSEQGRRLFYRFSPQVLPPNQVRQACDYDHDILGCVSGSDIYIAEYESNDEFNRAVVTGAHEMLHVAYSRLSKEEKAKLNDLLTQEISTLRGEVGQRIEGYEDESTMLNEAHSIIGTEVVEISQPLSDHYDRFFNARQKVIDAYQASPEG